MLRTGWKFLAICLLAALFGCGSGSKTDMEKGLEALDNQEWSEAIAIFSAMPKSADRDKYLSSAYAGAAGLDLIELAIQVSDALDTGDSTTVIFQVASDLLHPVDGMVEKAVLDEKIGYLSNAVNVYIANYESLPVPLDLEPYDLDNNQKIQVGLESAILSQYRIMAALPNLNDPTYVFVSPTALQQFLTDNGLAVADILDPAVADDLLTNLVGLVQTGVDAIAAINSGSNDIVADFNKFLEAIGYVGDSTLDVGNIQNYVNSILPAP